MEILDERMGAFRTEMMGIMGAHTLSFHEFHACGAPKFFWVEGPHF